MGGGYFSGCLQILFFLLVFNLVIVYACEVLEGRVVVVVEVSSILVNHVRFILTVTVCPLWEMV